MQAGFIFKIKENIQRLMAKISYKSGQHE